MNNIDRITRDMKYARIIALLAKQQNVTNNEAMDMLYTSPVFEIIDTGIADLICRSDQYLTEEITRYS